MFDKAAFRAKSRGAARTGAMLAYVNTLAIDGFTAQESTIVRTAASKAFGLDNAAITRAIGSGQRVPPEARLPLTHYLRAQVEALGYGVSDDVHDLAVVAYGEYVDGFVREDEARLAALLAVAPK